MWLVTLPQTYKWAEPSEFDLPTFVEELALNFDEQGIQRLQEQYTHLATYSHRNLKVCPVWPREERYDTIKLHFPKSKRAVFGNGISQNVIDRNDPVLYPVPH